MILIFLVSPRTRDPAKHVPAAAAAADGGADARAAAGHDPAHQVAAGPSSTVYTISTRNLGSFLRNPSQTRMLDSAC